MTWFDAKSGSGIQNWIRCAEQKQCSRPYFILSEFTIPYFDVENAYVYVYYGIYRYYLLLQAALNKMNNTVRVCTS